jgi:flagellar hook assembly protein FlgD
MNPQSDTEMAAQLAQFTSLQQSTQSTSSLAMIQANSLVGSTVQIQVDSTHTTNGVVTGVVMNNGAPQITVGGTNYNLSQLTAISPTTTTSGASSGTAGSGSTTGTAASSSSSQSTK